MSSSTLSSGAGRPTGASIENSSYHQPEVRLEELGEVPTRIEDIQGYVSHAFRYLREKGTQTLGREHTDEEVFFALTPPADSGIHPALRVAGQGPAESSERAEQFHQYHRRPDGTNYRK